MFDFLIDDAVEALVADHALFGHYQETTLKDLKVEYFDVNPRLKALNLPLVPKPNQEPTKADVPAAVGVQKFASPLDLQKTAISLILDYHDKRPIRVKLKDVGVTTSQYQNWLNDKDFHNRLQTELGKRFKHVDIDAQLSLSRLVQDGDLNAIKFYYEFTGKYRPNSETTINITVVLAKLMDVLVRHVDGEVLDSIASAIEAEVLQPLGQTA